MDDHGKSPDDDPNVLKFPTLPKVLDQGEAELVELLASKSFASERLKREVIGKCLEILRDGATLPEFAHPLPTAGLEKLTADEKADLTRAVTEIVKDAMRHARAPMVGKLIIATFHNCILEDRLEHR